MNTKLKFIKLLLIGLPLVAGLFLVGSSLWNGFNSAKASSWHSIQAKVQGAYDKGVSVVSVTRHLSNSGSGGRFSYSYEIAGREYTSSFVGFGFSGPTRSYRVGEYIEIYVNPRNHAQASLEAGIRRPHLTSMVFGCLFIFVAFRINKAFQ
ncbi:DUF3592 domain-containing protein [Gilvimarinus sp. DA14]|uniref:DUF3592 domain-containing protein n=1 Tax=Gilvimarinus sp. DA14 TaxID=2956798 RepID=UPI0020B6C5D0|nr:DUF3592 domain-containing protein [Gilvimarinus sp. DA14]UTF60674.1 DUF3592 domain-containing protein [Gilvimarinus sp. DA14]